MKRWTDKEAKRVRDAMKRPDIWHTLLFKGLVFSLSSKSAH